MSLKSEMSMGDGTRLPPGDVQARLPVFHKMYECNESNTKPHKITNKMN